MEKVKRTGKMCVCVREREVERERVIGKSEKSIKNVCVCTA